MRIDYQDISAFIEVVIDNAEKEGFSISSIDELYVYLQDNSSQHFVFVTRD